MTCSRRAGIEEISTPPLRAMTSACSCALSPSTSLTSNDDVEDGVWAALSVGISRAHAIVRKAVTTIARFSNINALLQRMECQSRELANGLVTNEPRERAQASCQRRGAECSK